MSFAFLVPNSPYLFLEDALIHLSSSGNYHQKNVQTGVLLNSFELTFFYFHYPYQKIFVKALCFHTRDLCIISRLHFAGGANEDV